MTRAWMPLYVGDYLSSTGNLMAMEHGAYLLLIMHYWKTGKSLPNDDRQLSRIARMTPEEWSNARALLEQFFSIDEAGWHHTRVERELAEAAARYERRAEAGRKGGLARKNEIRELKRNSQAMLQQC